MIPPPALQERASVIPARFKRPPLASLAFGGESRFWIPAFPPESGEIRQDGFRRILANAGMTLNVYWQVVG